MKYFRAEEDPTARLPKNFISGFLEVGCWKIYVG
jgi:NADH dehydrogenase (ubiquinone) 1 alpha subcomplex subunit 6